MPVPADKTLSLSFHGRIIDHLGIQMYQSPVAAVAEMVSNAWDADAEAVRITLPELLTPKAELLIADDGVGMTFEQCQNRFLEVGYNRRGRSQKSFTKEKCRPVLGRKGIGKFAGFGVARVIQIETISKENGERTVFELDSDRLRGDDYVGAGTKKIDVLEYDPPDDERRAEHGTTLRLKGLTIAERPSPVVFGKSMARRFLLHQQVADFEVTINGNPLPTTDDLERAQFVFPRDYDSIPGSAPEGLRTDDSGWGLETIGEDREIRWRFVFHDDPIQDDELQGIAVFAHGKLAQAPFDFNLSGGLGGQHGLEYLSGRVEAGYVDELSLDYIAPERQRIDWNRPETKPLRDWGQDRIKRLLRLWQELRGKEKLDTLTDKIEPFAERLDRLSRHDRQIVERALKKLAAITKIDNNTFRSLANAVLTAWEGGRLTDLIESVSDSEDLSPEAFLDLLMEAEVMTSLHTAEAVRTKLEVIEGLRARITERELENPLRDYIAQHPWLISPKWETFQRERSVEHVIRAAAIETKLDREEGWDRRIDLVLSSGDSLLVLEFMRPGVTIDFDHINRFGFYMTAIRTRIEANTVSRFRQVSAGYLVADNLIKSPTVLKLLEQQAALGNLVTDWGALLADAEAQWYEFIEILANRAPCDDRLKALAEDTNGSRPDQGSDSAYAGSDD